VEDAVLWCAYGELYLSWGDFKKTRDAGWNRPFFTYALLFMCTGVPVARHGLNGWWVEQIKINPMIGPSAQTLIRMVAKQTTIIVIEGGWYRRFSPMVLQAGLIHYFLVMAALWFIGKAVEQFHGFAAATILFIIPAVGGISLSAIFLLEYISVGALGRIFGLVGTCITNIYINCQLLFSRHINTSDQGMRFYHLKVLLWLLFNIVVSCLVGFVSFVDNLAHLGAANKRDYGKESIKILLNVTENNSKDLAVAVTG
jgi:membrane associated rhomboid family serine protease